MVQNKLKVTVLNGRNLKSRDATQNITPYCLLQLGSTSYETRYINGDTDPEWNEEFTFDASRDSEVLSFSIWHKNALKNDVVIAYAFVDFGSCKKDHKTTFNIKLMGNYTGEVNLLIVPIYETTASRLKRMDHEIMLLTYDVNKYKCKIEQLNKEVNKISEENNRLSRINKSLEKERKILLEYEVLSSGNEINSNGKLNLISDDFDIITEQDIKGTLFKNIEDGQRETFQSSMTDFWKTSGDVKNLKENIDLEKGLYILDDWQRHFTENVEVLQEEIVRLNRRDSKQNKCMKNSYVDKSELSRLLSVDNELITNSEINNAGLDVGVTTRDRTLINKIHRLLEEKNTNDAKILILKEVIADVDNTNRLSVRNEITENQKMRHNSEGSESNKHQEYFWDNFLPVSIRQSNAKEINENKSFNDLVDEITDDIDQFLQSNYVLQEKTLIHKSDPELNLWSVIEQEAEHFKEINIRLIKENQELSECLNLLEEQVSNFKELLKILFEQLMKRLPKYMRDKIDEIYDDAQTFDDYQDKLYLSNFDAVLNELINGTDEQTFTDTPNGENYCSAISLLYHQLST